MRGCCWGDARERVDREAGALEAEVGTAGCDAGRTQRKLEKGRLWDHPRLP